MHITFIVLQAILGLMFLMAGLMKLGAKQRVEMFQHYGYPQWFRVVTGIVEIVGGRYDNRNLVSRVGAPGRFGVRDHDDRRNFHSHSRERLCKGNSTRLGPPNSEPARCGFSMASTRSLREIFYSPLFYSPRIVRNTDCTEHGIQVVYVWF